MPPQLGAATEDHSIFFTERVLRLFRSLLSDRWGGVRRESRYDHRRRVRDYHLSIEGVDEKGGRYSPLNPDVFYWAHATFFMGTILTAERFGGGLTKVGKRQLFDERITLTAFAA